MERGERARMAMPSADSIESGKRICVRNGRKWKKRLIKCLDRRADNEPIPIGRFSRVSFSISFVTHFFRARFGRRRIRMLASSLSVAAAVM